MKTRSLAIDILQEINKGGYSHLVLKKMLKQSQDQRDRALITTIVYGVLRWRNRLDYIISRLADRPLSKIDKTVLEALRVGLYQIEFLDRVPDRAAVNETVAAVKQKTHRGSAGFVNGILRAYLRLDSIEWPDREKEKTDFIASYYSHPRWLVRNWLQKYGFRDTVSLCKYNNCPPGLTVRRNTLKWTREELLSAFKNDNICIRETAVPESFVIENARQNIEELPGLREGGFMIQGSAATLAGYILDPQPGERVLDMTAGPGGKTTHLGELMENRGQLVALDIYDHKLKLIRENCRRLGITIVETKEADAVDYTSGRQFDRILLDAPCSGLGVVAGKPELKWKRVPADIEQLARLQLQLLENACRLLKPGGNLLYCTCTLTERENRDVISKFRERCGRQLKQLAVKPDLERLELNDICDEAGDKCLELWPPGTGLEGFFFAKFRKKD